MLWASGFGGGVTATARVRTAEDARVISWPGFPPNRPRLPSVVSRPVSEVSTLRVKGPGVKLAWHVENAGLRITCSVAVPLGVRAMLSCAPEVKSTVDVQLLPGIKGSQVRASAGRKAVTERTQKAMILGIGVSGMNFGIRICITSTFKRQRVAAWARS